MISPKLSSNITAVSSDLQSSIHEIENEIINNFGDIKDLTDDMNINDETIPTKLEAWNKSDYVNMKKLSEIFNSNKKNFCLMSLNVQSLNAKHDNLVALTEYLEKENASFTALCLQETWLSENADLSLLQLDGFNLISQGKTCGAHGGLAIYLQKDLSYELETIRTSKLWEAQVVKIKNDKQNELVILNLYRPPRCNDKNEIIESFLKELAPVVSDLQNKNSNVAIVGDFNIDLLKINERNLFSEFFDIMLSNSFYPQITMPTRFAERRGSLIDNIFCKLTEGGTTSSPGILLSCISDHLPCFTCLSFEICTPPSPKYVLRRDRKPSAMENIVKDIPEMISSAELDMNLKADPNQNYNKIEGIIKKAVDMHMPLKRVKFNKYRHKKKKWVTNGILKSISFRDKMLAKLKKLKPMSQKYQALKLNLATYKNHLRKCIRKAKMIYYDQEFLKYKDDMKRTWGLINNIIIRRGSKHNFPKYFNVERALIDDKAVIANKFNNFFTSIGSELAQSIDIDGKPKFNSYLTNAKSSRFSFKTVDSASVVKVIKSLKPKTSCGHDGLSMKFIREIYPAITEPLTLIINQSIATSVFPNRLKIARVIPIFKKGDDKLLGNYRPISLLPAISKIFEKLMYNQMYNYFLTHKLLYSSQYGFRKKHSTEMAAIELTDRLMKDVENGHIPVAVFLDLSKAFDTLDHQILTYKLKYYGFDEAAVNLMQSYLTDRKQYVEINGVASEKKDLTMGVPQGSILGPLLFIIYMNDINEASNIFNFILYADDSTLQSKLQTHTYENEAAVINVELAKIANWLAANKLTLNISKSKFMVFSTNRRDISTITRRFSLVINNTEIERVSKFNFLGLTLDEFLSWTEHINIIQYKISRISGILNRLKHHMQTNILKLVYSALVLPHLNYALLVWGHRPGKITKLQKRVVRIIGKSKYNAHTEPILKRLGLLKISDMYQQKMLVFYYKLQNNQLPEYMQNFKIITGSEVHSHNTRYRSLLRPDPASMKLTQNRIEASLPKIINNTSKTILDKTHTHSLYGFKKYIKATIIDKYSLSCHEKNCFVCK